VANKANLRPASFRGIPFKIKRATTRVGRRVITHEFPFKDVPYTEDLGRGAREYTLEAHVIGDGHEDIRDQLIQAIEGNKEPGILMHPIFGAVRVVPGPIEHVFDNSEGNIEYFNFTFLEAGENKYPSQLVHTRGNVEVAATGLKEALKSAFDETFKVQRLPGFVTQSAQSTHSRLITELQQVTEIAPTISKYKTAFQQSIKQLSSGTILASTSYYSATVQESMDALQGLFISTSDAFQAYQNLSVFDDDFLPIPQTSPNRKIEKRNRDLQVALVKRHALIGMALTASQMTFASYDEAVALRDTLAQKLDAELDQIGTTDDDTLFSAVSHLERGHGIGHYRTGRKSRPNQTYFSSRTHTCPSDGL
jgi:prophage DNA circulation protein